MNPNAPTGPNSPEQPPLSPEQTPEPVTPEVNPVYNPELQQKQVNPEVKDEPQQVHVPPANPYSPPSPGAFQPNYQEPMPTPNQTATIPEGSAPEETHNPNLPVNQEVAKKKAQARKLLIAAIVFAVLFVLGIILVTVLFVGNSSTDEGTKSLDDQLKDDLNTFALGVANFRNGSDFFTITSEDVARLRTGYIPTEFNDPRTSSPYVVTSEIPKVGDIQYIPGGVCNEDDSITQSGNDENFATRILLEEQILHCIQRSEIEVPNP